MELQQGEKILNIAIKYCKEQLPGGYTLALAYSTSFEHVDGEAYINVPQ